MVHAQRSSKPFWIIPIGQRAGAAWIQGFSCWLREECARTRKNTRKVSSAVRALLLALVEPEGPLESQGIWGLVLPAALKAEYFEAFLYEEGTLSVDQASIRPQDSARWAIAKQLSAEVAVAPLLRAGADFEAMKAHCPLSWESNCFPAPREPCLLLRRYERYSNITL